MRYVIFYFFLFFMEPLTGWSQQWAGPDTATCGQLGVVIGSQDPCPGCCYLWYPAAGLSCTDCKNPTAKPEAARTYTVEVLDENLRFKGKDEVLVEIEFGEMKFSPEFLIQGSEESEVHASLLNLGNVNNPSQITWDIFGPNLNCQISPQGLGAILTPGNLYGDIEVEARKNSVPGCYVRKSLPVNNGVKDVYAIDPDHMNRFAKTGETLYVISHENVIIHAIPNPGGFKEGIPNWKPDAYGSNIPPNGEDYVSISQPIGSDDVISDYIAGDSPDFKPKVTVVRKPAQPTDETVITLEGLDAAFEGLTNLLKFRDQPAIDPPCGPLYPFNLSLTTPVVKFNSQIVEKYGTPRLSTKQELALEMELVATGRAFHPVFTKSFTSRYFNVTLCSRLFIEANTTLSANIKIVKDPSLADSLFQAVNPEIVWGIGIGGGAEFAFNPPGYLLSAKAKIGANAKMTTYYESQKLQTKFKVGQVVTKVEAKIQSISNMGEFEDLAWGVGNFSRELELIAPKEFGPYTLYNFQN